MSYPTVLQRLFLAASIGLFAGHSLALTELQDNELSQVEGAGLAFAVEDFRYQMKPTSYFWQLGEPTQNTGTVFQRGDLRWLGLSVTSTGAANSYGFAGENTQDGWTSPVGPTFGSTVAAFDNPYLLRVFDYSKLNFAGNNESRTVLELLGPSATSRYRWAFWGQVIVSGPACANDNYGQPNSSCFGNGGVDAGYAGSPDVPGLGLLESQTLIHGSPVAPNQNDLGGQTYGPVLRMFRTSAAEDPVVGTQADPTVGFIYHSRLQGDFRFSLSRNGTSADGVPLFNNGDGSDVNGNGVWDNGEDAPGLKFRKVNAYMPLGQMHYQVIRLDDTVPGNNSGKTTGSGDFTIELTALPYAANAYNDFYSFAAECSSGGASNGPDCGYRTTREFAAPSRYYETHGYVHWGDWSSGVANPGEDNVGNGMVFTAVPGQTFTAAANRDTNTASHPDHFTNSYSVSKPMVNFGRSKIDGLLIQHLKITTLGAGS